MGAQAALHLCMNPSHALKSGHAIVLDAHAKHTVCIIATLTAPPPPLLLARARYARAVTCRRGTLALGMIYKFCELMHMHNDNVYTDSCM
eukprot:5231877-Pleurochrysis_carterae.AAC.2